MATPKVAEAEAALTYASCAVCHCRPPDYACYCRECYEALTYLDVQRPICSQASTRGLTSAERRYGRDHM
jgi:hypothetical protein